MSKDVKQYFICLEYYNPVSKKYGKTYISFDESGLIYDVIYRYTIEEIDSFLAVYPKEQILEQIGKDNVIYFTNDIKDINNTNLSIHYIDASTKKERVSVPVLKSGCYFFDIEKYFKEELNLIERKNIYNKLGGYLTNQHILKETKEWIQHLSYATGEELWKEYAILPYLEQRKIKIIIYENLSKELQQNLQKKPELKKHILKKDLAS